MAVQRVVRNFDDIVVVLVFRNFVRALKKLGGSFLVRRKTPPQQG